MTGFKGGYVAGVGVHSYEQVRGAAYRTMIEHGIDHETARAAAMDEAVVSALIEAADAGVDVLTFGLNSVLGNIGNAAARKAITLLGKYGINVLGEGTEEGLQQSVSYANLDRVQRGDYDPNANGFERVWDLIAGSGNTLGDAVTGRDTTARDQILDAMGQGAKLAALFGGPTAVAFDLVTNPIQQTSSQTTVKPVQSPTERDIINTTQLWTQQLNEAAGIQSEEVQMVDADNGSTNLVEETYETAVEQMVGVKTSTGIKVSDVSTHIVERMNERQIAVSYIIDALCNPLKQGVIREDGSQQFIGEKATVVINTNTGKIVTVWATKSKLAEKLRGGE